MSRRAALGAVLAAALLGGCASADTYSPPAAAVSGDARSLEACTSGSQACIDAVVAEMRRRYSQLARACDHRAPFALMYLRVTEGVQSPASGRFTDAVYLRHLDALFARLYFRAFDAWQSGRRDVTPGAWRIAFESAADGRSSGIGDMLLGMNAHISNDLPFAVREAGLRNARGRSARDDFDAVNNVLEEIQGPMLREEARAFDPAIANTALPSLGVYGGDVAGAIANWRTEAWQNGMQLTEAGTPSERGRIAARIRRSAAQRARVIQALTSNRLLGADRAARDVHCRGRSR